MNHRGSIEEALAAWVEAAFGKAFPDTDFHPVKLGVLPTEEEAFGDYQCNAAMPLARILRRKPRDIAEAVVQALPPPPAVARVEVAGPGFINLTLDDRWLARKVETMLEDERLGVPRSGEGRTVILDYSSPNVAKPMHIGHVRSTVIGNALDRMHRFLGSNVTADNHIGDWGTQFGILILGYRQFADEDALQRDPVEELQRIYIKSYERSKENPAWLNQARRELVKLQQGDPENRALWETFVGLSLKEFERLYQRLDVRFDLVRGESYYQDRLAALVEALEAKGIVCESEGARVAFLEDEQLPVCIVQKSDGGFNYATTDLATIVARVEEFRPDSVVYVTDERQQLHFRQVFAVARRMGIACELAHVWFGLMRLPEGTFSTREGNVIKLERLLDEAEARALSIVKEASPDMSPEEQEKVARAVGIGAVKYADLCQNPQSTVTFTWEKALSLEGNSAPYLQYACARIASVHDKYRERFPGSDPARFPIVLGEPVERTLARLMIRFPDVLRRATASYKPNMLADYLYGLAQQYSTFYQNIPFLKAEEGVRESRVRLCDAVARVLRQGLELLGVQTPARI